MLRTHCQTSGVSLHRAGPLQQRHPHDGRGAWPRCWAAPSRCTPTRSTRRWRCRPSSPPASPATRSSSSPEETGITHVVDPLGGSYYIEALTNCWRPGAGADRRGRGPRRHDQGGRERHAEAARSRKPPPRVRRGSTGRGRGRRHQQVPARQADERSTSSTSTTPPSASSRSRGSSRSAPAATRRRARAALDALTEAARDGAATCWRWRSRRRGPGRRSARFPTRWRRSSAVTARPIRSVSGVYGAAYEGDAGFAAIQKEVADFAERRGPPSAHAGGQDGPGRPRPRRQGDRHRLRRYRLRRRCRARCSRLRTRRRGRRSRTTSHVDRRVQPGRRSQDAGPVADRGTAQGRAGGHHRRRAAASSRPRTTTSCGRPASPRSIGPGTNIPKAAHEILGIIRD